MSANEYHDLYLKCQSTGKYHMFLFDMVGSKKMPTEKRQLAQIQMLDLLNRMYESIQEIEKETGKKILVLEDGFVTYKSNKPYRGFGMKQEPFVLGDMFGFTVYRDTLSEDIVYYLYEKHKQEIGIDFDFHLANGYYETSDYGEGGTKYFRGYCIDTLSNLQKEKTQREIAIVKKKLIRQGELHD